MTNATALPPHNWPVYGHDWAVNHLRKAIQHGRSRHAYLITGVDRIGKRSLAYAFAMALNAPHPTEAGNIDHDHRHAHLIREGGHADIITPTYDEKTGALKIQAMRAVTTALSLKPYEARYRVAIITDFERANPQSQDALLKTLEEPAEHALLLITANTTDDVLATITSRCQTVNLRPLALDSVRKVLIEQHGLSADDAELLARVSGGRLGWALAAIHDRTALDARADYLDALARLIGQKRSGRFKVAQDMAKLDKLDVFPVLELWLTYWRDVLLAALGTNLPLTNIDHERTVRELAAQVSPDAARTALLATRQTLVTLQTTNTNPRLALEVLFLDYPGLSQ